MLRKIYYNLSPELRLLARKIFYFPLDIVEGFSGKRQNNVPKKGDIFIGSGDFIAQGEKQVEALTKHINLKNSDRVLDIGCGIGRTAFALKSIIDMEGSYDGFDAMKKGIDWCKKNIQSEKSNFNFTYVPLRNPLYNKSSEDAAFFKFPYGEEEFDKAFLFSVFTHMKIEEIQNYLNEIHRVLKTDGQCLATFFIYTSEENIDLNAGFKFPIKKDGYRLLDKNLEEANIAIDFDFLKNMVALSGLTIEKKIDGFWKEGKQNGINNDFQDILVLKK